MDTLTRSEIRHSLTGTSLQVVERKAAVFARWVEVCDSRGNHKARARAAVCLAECQRIATLMGDRGWDMYLIGNDDEAH